MMKTVRWLIGTLVTGVLVSGAAANASLRDQRRAPREDRQSGGFLFRVYCISCHGESGKGDGPVADLLKRPPTDLTRIAQRAGGVFPTETVMQQIDGRLTIRSHGRQDMPIWGDALKITEGRDERVVRQRIEAIASHLESIQVKTP